MKKGEKFERDLVWIRRIKKLGLEKKRKARTIWRILKEHYIIDIDYIQINSRKSYKHEISPMYIGALIRRYKRGVFDGELKDKKS